MVEGYPRWGGTALAGGVLKSYEQGQTDYSLEPLILTGTEGLPIGRIQPGDAVIFCCRRGEREIELTEAFTDPDFSHFTRPKLDNLNFIILTLYHEKFKLLPVAFAPGKVDQCLGEAVSKAGLTQLHISESEKFAHVTFFFNGGLSQPFAGEQDWRYPSPQGIPFEQIPELSLPQVASGVCRGIQQGFDLVVANFANGDVIGHTSNREAKLRCAQVVDLHLGEVLAAARGAGYLTLITADHGNLEEMTGPEGEANVSHTANPVALILVDPLAARPAVLEPGSLQDVAPTILSAMGLACPEVMTGKNLASGYAWGAPRKVLLLILDGWGLGPRPEDDPIALAPTPTWDSLLAGYSSTLLQAAGTAVGLKAGKAGNSEAGHMNLGAGRVVVQDDVRLDQAMRDGTFARNEVFTRAIASVKQRGSSLHLIGLLTEKSSHGSIDYPLALLEMACAAGLEKVYLHMILDGRSTQPGSAPGLLRMLEERVAAAGTGQIVTAVGRGLALDRDGNYTKIRKAYEALVYGTGTPCVMDEISNG